MIKSSQLPNNIDDFQIPFPFKEDSKFETFITDYFNHLENTISYDKFGRSGQTQYGLDVFSHEKLTVIQCKLKSNDRSESIVKKELIKELKDDFNLFNVYNQNEKLGYTKFIFASTFKSDTSIQNECVKLSKNGITVEYWSWDRLIRQLPNDTKQKYFEYLLDENNAIYSSSRLKFKALDIDKTEPILEQLYQYVSDTFREVDKYPNHLIAKHYPFKKDDESYTYYSNFNLNINNSEVYNLLNSIQINNQNVVLNDKKFSKGIKNPGKKIKTILSKLTGNLIYSIESSEGRKRVETKYFSNNKCDCIRCDLNRLNFDVAFPKFKKKENTIGARMKVAYTNYQYGNFATAANQFLEISKDAKKKDLPITHFICNYNLKRLKTFIRNHYSSKVIHEDLIKRINKIDLEVLEKQFRNSHHYELIKWINSDSFYSETRDKIHKISTKIRDHYYSQLKGGWNSSSAIYDLINEYADIEMFLNNNFIVFDGFTEFKELSKNFTEILFASLAMNSSQNGRLRHFDDWIIHKLITYSDSYEITKYFKRYNLESIIYEQSVIKNDANNFIEKFNNFFNNKNTKNLAEKYFESDNQFFWNRYTKTFESLITIASLINFSDDVVNEMVHKIIAFIKTDTNIHVYRNYRIEVFVKRKSRQITKENLRLLLMTVIDNPKTHYGSIIDSIADAIENNHTNVALPKKYYTIIEKMVFDKCPSCKSKHPSSIIISIYRITKETEIKKKISTLFSNYLTNTFEADMFYEAVLWDIMKPSRTFMNNFILHCSPSPNRKSFKEVFSGTKDEVDRTLNMLFNLCFKCNIDMSSHEFSHIKSINNYYNWLLDMKNFNYNLFNPMWVGEYPTKYFYNKIRESNIVKVKLIEYIKTTNAPELERIFMDIYYKFPN